MSHSSIVLRVKRTSAGNVGAMKRRTLVWIFLQIETTHFFSNSTPFLQTMNGIRV